MPAINLFPAAQGTDTSGTNVGGTVPTNVSSDDGDTSYRQFQGSTEVFTTTLDDLPAEAQVVTNVDAHNKGRWDGVGSQGSFFSRVRDASTPLNHGTSNSPNTSYVEYTSNFPNAYDSAAWTVAKVNACELGLEINGGYGAGRLRLTYQYLAVTYLSGGDFTFLVGSLVGMLGSALCLSDIPRIASYMRRNMLGFPTPDEYVDFLRALKAPRRAYA